MIDTPFWDGNPHHKYPSVTARLDFRERQTAADLGVRLVNLPVLSAALDSPESGQRAAVVRFVEVGRFAGE
jgi:hypothetical protein